MINGIATGKPGETGRLFTIESVWIQGQLSMWGRWSHIGGGHGGNMFNTLLASKTVSKTAIQQILSHLKKSGMDDSDLKRYFLDLLEGKQKSSLAFCSDTEGLQIDAVIGEILVTRGYSALFNIISDRYRNRMSKKAMARQLQEKHPEWSLRTCETRIDVYLQTAESMLYAPLCFAFDKDPERYRLKSCAGVA